MFIKVMAASRGGQFKWHFENGGRVTGNNELHPTRHDAAAAPKRIVRAIAKAMGAGPVRFKLVSERGAAVSIYRILPACTAIAVPARRGGKAIH